MAQSSVRRYFHHEKNKSASASRETACVYRALAEKKREVLYLIDPDGWIKYINPAISHYGVHLQQFIGKKYSEFIAPEDSARVEAAIQQALAGQAEIFDFRLLIEPGRSVCIRASCDAIYENGTLLGVAGMILELGSSQQFEKALEKHASQLMLINEIGEKISSILEIDQILFSAASLLQKRFGYYHVAIFTPDPESGDAVMTARSGSFATLFPPKHRLKSGQGMIGWVCENHATLLANDVRHEIAYVNMFPDRIPTQSELSVPILVVNELVGVLDIQSPLLNAFDDDDVRVIETIASQLSVAMVNARLYDEVRLRLREQEHAETMLRLQRDLLDALGSAHAYQTTLEELIRILHPLNVIDTGSLYLVDDLGGLYGVAHTGLGPDFIQVVTYLPPEAHKTRFVMAGKIGYLRYADLNFDPRIPDKIRKAEGLLSLAVLPMLHQGRVIASLTLGSHNREEIPAETRGLLESVASYLASTLARVQAEIALNQSEARNRALLQSLPDLMFVVDQDGRFLDFNYDTESILYVPPEKIIGHRLEEILPPPIAKTAREAVRNAIDSHLVQQFEYDLTLADQKERTFEARLSAASETLVIAVVREITLQRVAERERQRILEMESRLNKISTNSLTANSPAALIQNLLNESSQVLGVSRAFLSVLDEQSQELTITAEWSMPAIPIVSHPGQKISIQPYLHWLEQVQQNQPILITGCEDDPAICQLKEMGILSFLAMPLFVQESLYGILVYEQRLQMKNWSSEDTSFVRSAAHLAEQAIERFQNIKALEQNNQELKRINQSLVEMNRLKSN